MKASFQAKRCALIAGALLVSSAAASAQAVDCARLQADIASVRANPAASARFVAEAQRQQRDLDRLASYAKSIGCENHQFLFFGSAPPPQCNQINPRIQRMRANLGRLQQEAAAAGGEGQRRALQARYNASCGGGAQAALHGPRSFFEQLFGGGDETPPPQEVPIGPPPAAPVPTQIGGGSKAVCVKTCDGGFFPVSYVANRSEYPQLQAECDALCPNVSTQLFTYSGSGVIDQAVSASDGKPYSSLPNAGLFRTHYDPACTCKPPHESWAQALAGAEKIVGPHPSDIIVTPQKSAEMARVVSSPQAGKVSKRAKGKSSTANSDADEETAVDLANSAAGPTVGQESSDIGGVASKAKFFPESSGKIVEEAGPNGVKRRVRIIGPLP